MIESPKSPVFLESTKIEEIKIIEEKNDIFVPNPEKYDSNSKFHKLNHEILNHILSYNSLFDLSKLSMTSKELNYYSVNLLKQRTEPMIIAIKEKLIPKLPFYYDDKTMSLNLNDSICHDEFAFKFKITKVQDENGKPIYSNTGQPLYNTSIENGIERFHDIRVKMGEIIDDTFWIFPNIHFYDDVSKITAPNGNTTEVSYCCEPLLLFLEIIPCLATYLCPSSSPEIPLTCQSGINAMFLVDLDEDQKYFYKKVITLFKVNVPFYETVTKFNEKNQSTSLTNVTSIKSSI